MRVFLLFILVALSTARAGAAESGHTVAIDFLWLCPRFALESVPSQFPLPVAMIERMLVVAAKNPDADVILWVDSNQMTPTQISSLVQLVSRQANFSVRDLRTIEAYGNEDLFNYQHYGPGWQSDKDSLFWRQIDAAKILLVLQPGYQQRFYSDIDISNLVVSSAQVQSIISKYGIVFSGVNMCIPNMHQYGFENQLFGTDSRGRFFFEELYRLTLDDAYLRGENGYGAFITLIDSYLRKRLGIKVDELIFPVRRDVDQVDQTRRADSCDALLK